MKCSRIIEKKEKNLSKQKRSAASDLGLLGLPMSHKKDARLI